MNTEVTRLRAELAKTERARKCGWRNYFAQCESYRLFVSSVLENGHLNDAQKRILREMFLNQEDNHKTCVICSDVMSDDLVLSKCAHIHHKECLLEWTKRSNTCPVCREVITTLVDL